MSSTTRAHEATTLELHGSAIWSTHELTAAAASSRVMSRYEPARAAAKSARQRA